MIKTGATKEEGEDSKEFLPGKRERSQDFYSKLPKIHE
jgi:hypothetical protein